MKTKRCSDCNADRPVSEFDVNLATKSGLQHYCREHKRLRVLAGRAKDPEKHIVANRENHRRHYAKDPKAYLTRVKARRRRNPAKYKAADRRAKLMHRYGLTEDSYNELLRAANGCCQICKRKMKKLHIDHDHETGKVRGLLCMTCNQGLGKLGDTLERLLVAVEYLRAAG